LKKFKTKHTIKNSNLGEQHPNFDVQDIEPGYAVWFKGTEKRKKKKLRSIGACLNREFKQKFMFTVLYFLFFPYFLKSITDFFLRVK
jgi:hypothetical protein